MPRETSWTPGESSYTPPSDNSDWIPPTWNPPTPSEDTAVASNPMDVLIDMGFANRELNADLLRRFGNNVDRVVQELISDSEWSATRH